MSLDVLGCPVCKAVDRPATQVGRIEVCAHCGSSLVYEIQTDTYRRATAADTDVLTPAQLTELRRVRGDIVRTGRR